MNLVDLILSLYEVRKIPQFLFLSPIDNSSMVEVRKKILEFRNTYPDENEIDFIINSPGGSPSDAYRIIRTLRDNFEKVNVIVPFWAKSAATLLSLGANQIIMDEFGEFGPLDIQIGKEREDSPEMDRESALNDEYSVRRIEARSQELYYQMFINLYSSDDIKINKNELSKQLFEYLASFYKPLLKQINPYHLGRKKRMLDIGEKYAGRILMSYNPDLPERNRNALIDYLVNRCPDHGYVIDYRLISLFLENVTLSREISEEYKNILSNIATIFIEYDGEDNFVGFIMPEVEEQQEPSEKSTSKSNDSKTDRKAKESKASQNGVEN